MTENEIAKQIVDVAFKIHTTFGPGLLESVYETIMAYELQKRGLSVRRQQAIPVIYEEVRMDLGFRADLIIEAKVVVENQIRGSNRTRSQEATTNLPSAH
jgi:GxxExxY protein